MSTIFGLLDEIERLSVKIQNDSKELLEQINKNLGIQEEVEDDGENVKPRTEREWDEMDKGDDEYHARVDNNL